LKIDEKRKVDISFSVIRRIRLIISIQLKLLVLCVCSTYMWWNLGCDDKRRSSFLCERLFSNNYFGKYCITIIGRMSSSK